MDYSKIGFTDGCDEDVRSAAMPKSPFSREYETFRQTLISARTSAGVSQEELAARLTEMGFNVTQSVVSKVERGERRLDVVEFILFAAAVGFDPCNVILQIRNAMSERH